MATGVTTIKRGGLGLTPEQVNREINFIVSQLNSTNLTENVLAATIADKELLSYDATNNYWINRTAAEADLLSPVVITAAASGDYLRYNGTNWVDVTIATIVADITGSMPLGGPWDAGSFKITAETFESDVATGTAPLTVASTTVVTNLNADLLDSQTGSYYLDSDNLTGLDDIVAGSGIGVTDGAGTIVGGNATVAVGALTGNHDWGDYEARTRKFYADEYLEAANMLLVDDKTIRMLTDIPSTLEEKQRRSSDLFSGMNVAVGRIGPTGSPDSLGLLAQSIVSGTFANARISESSVTQHETALAIVDTQLSGTDWTDLTDAGETALHIHDAMYYTETELDAGQLDNRYFTETESDARFSPLAGSASIVTVGTIASGTWEGTTVAVLQGGTGVTALDDIIGGSGIVATAGVDTVVGGDCTLDLGALSSDVDLGDYEVRSRKIYGDEYVEAGNIILADGRTLEMFIAEITDLLFKQKRSRDLFSGAHNAYGITGVTGSPDSIGYTVS